MSEADNAQGGDSVFYRVYECVCEYTDGDVLMEYGGPPTGEVECHKCGLTCQMTRVVTVERPVKFNGLDDEGVGVWKTTI